eukprot:SAG22_NODE_11054_length_503_cov_0.655941_2_plen_101_part_01
MRARCSRRRQLLQSCSRGSYLFRLLVMLKVNGCPLQLARRGCELAAFWGHSLTVGGASQEQPYVTRCVPKCWLGRNPLALVAALPQRPAAASGRHRLVGSP